MIAIQIKQVGGPEAMELAELPVPHPKTNEAVVKLSASGVNFIDVFMREGRYPAPLPLVLGQEGAGIVTALGAEAKSVKVGDRVAWSGVLGAWEDYRIRVDEYRELDGERVLVLTHNTGRGKTSGLELERVGTRGANVFHIYSGKVTRLVVYFDRERALADLGLADG